MSYLEQYDALPDDSPQAKVGLVSGWLRTDWRDFFKELRENRPIFPVPGITLVTRYDDVQEVLSRHTVFTVRLYAPKMDPVVGPFMLARDETEINYREKSVMKAMLQWEDLPAVRAMAGRIADEALDRAAPAGRIEVVSGLGRHVPVRLCGDYFGFPGPDEAAMFRWSKATQTNMFKNLTNNAEVHEAAVQAGAEMKPYLQTLMKQKRECIANGSGVSDDPTRPTDVFTRLLLTHLPGDVPFDDERILSNMMGLLVGSVETTSQAVAQVIEQLLLRPEIAEQAREAARAGDDAKFDSYVWEALRFNPINPLIFRLCVSEYTLAAGTPRETTIPAGTVVFACTSSAQFDAGVVKDPEEFRPDRPPHHTMHFGWGEHTCLGKYVSTVVIPEVVKRVLLRPSVALLPGEEGKIDFGDSFFPERFKIALGA